MAATELAYRKLLRQQSALWSQQLPSEADLQKWKSGGAGCRPELLWLLPSSNITQFDTIIAMFQVHPYCAQILKPDQSGHRAY